MRPPLHIAILECDEPVGATKEKYGTYGKLFSKLLHSGADKLAHDSQTQSPVELQISSFDIVKQPERYPDLSEIDAILLTGSKFNAFDNEEWILKLVEFTRKVIEEQERVRLIGICFGHQIIGRAMGAKVDRSDKGWEVAVYEVQLTDKGKEVFGSKDGVLRIHQMHRDIVYEWPKGVERLGSTPRCEVQGMYIKNRIITVQGHPEFDGDVVSELLERRKEAGVFDDNVYGDGMDRVRKPHDGVSIGASFLRFLLEE